MGSSAGNTGRIVNGHRAVQAPVRVPDDHASSPSLEPQRLCVQGARARLHGEVTLSGDEPGCPDLGDLTARVQWFRVQAFSSLTCGSHVTYQT